MNLGEKKSRLAWPNQGVIFLLKVYHRLFSFLPRRCIYVPSCSSYACEAFTKYGFFKSCKLVIFRLFRCNPWAKGGWDPVR